MNMPVPKLRELRAVIENAKTWDDVKNAQTRTLAFLRSKASKEIVSDFEDIGPGPSLGGPDTERVNGWKTQLLSYMDGLLDAA
jgi:hypothetical protein